MKKHKVKLIDGNFENANAKLILLDLIENKIKHHELKEFSNIIRFGNDREKLSKRVQELIQEKKNLVEWLDSIDKRKTIKIKGIIQLEIT
jgi:hypothetical protein